MINTFTFSKQHLEKEFALFLNEQNILKDLEAAAIQYETVIRGLTEKEKFPPSFRFTFTLNLKKLKSISEKLYKLFIKEPLIGLNLARDVIFCAIDLVIASVTLEKTDLQIIPLVTNVPFSDDIFSFFTKPSFELKAVQGLLISKTTTIKYVRSSFYSCELLSCPRNKWQRHFKTMGNICPDCNSPMKKHISSTDVGDEILCHILPLKAYHSKGRFQAIPVKIKDELCFALNFNIGEEYFITGRSNENFFEAMNIESIPLSTENISDIPESIANLHFKISQAQGACPWSFVIAISSLLASYILPLSSFLHLKIGLMLSVATVESDAPVPLVAVGSDLLNTQILFQAAGKLSDRYIKRSVTHSYLGGTLKTESQSDVIHQEAGQLILATKGICDLGDWTKLKTEQLDYIYQTIESGRIAFNKGGLGKPNLAFVPLRCAIWTYWCNSTKNARTALKLKKLINVFGMPFLAEEKNEKELYKICCKNISTALNAFNSDDCKKFIQTDDLKQFFKIINSRELVLSEEASQLIRSYFVTSRRDRPHCLPIGAIKTITSLAVAHARLALRYEVSPEDVVAVIYLYEIAIVEYYGKSLTSSTLCSLFTKIAWNEDEPFYAWMRKQMMQFSDWLEEYVTF